MRSKKLGNLVVAVGAVLTGLLVWVMSRGPSDLGGEAPILPQRPATAKPRDLVVITIDTLRVDRLSSYGSNTAETPAIDALAARGVRFDQATTPFPRTTPAVASLFTGLWPHHHGSREVWEPVTQGRLLAEVLHDAGYATAGVTSNRACGTQQNLGRGFDTLREFGELASDNAEQVTNVALELVGQVPTSSPMFLWVHYVDPHWRYDPPERSFSASDVEHCWNLQLRLGRQELTGAQILSNHGGVAADALEDCRRLYDAEVEYVDRQIGRLLDELRAAGRWSDTLFVLTSDHGENMGEDDYWFGHGPSVHEVAMRVPLILSGPGLPEGKVDRGVARLEDVMPTLLAVLGIAERPKMDGTALDWRWDPSAGLPDHPVREAFAESGTPLRAEASTFLVSGDRSHYCVNEGRYSGCKRLGRQPEFFDRQVDPGLASPLAEVPPQVRSRLSQGLRVWKPETARQRTVRTTAFKLVDVPRLEGGYRRELYDLTADPGQTRDVSAEHPDIAQELGTKLERWLADVPIYEARQRTDEEIEELRALGYMR